MTEDIRRDGKLNRRQFVTDASKAIIAAGLTKQAVNAAKADEAGLGLTKLTADTEKKESPLKENWPVEKQIRFAIVGLGHLSLEEILPAFGACKKARVTALVSGHRDKALRLARSYNIDEKNIYDYGNFDEIANNNEIDAVYIVLPNSMHCDFTVRAAKAGKHVLCEKPMATSSKDCQTMIDVCKANNRKLMIAYRIQYEPINMHIRKLVRNQSYGKVKIIEASNGQNQGDPDQWRQKKALSGGGALPDIGIYCLNTVRSMLGEEPVQVFATTFSTPGDPRFAEVEENVAFQMKFPSGVIAICGSGYGYHEARQYRVFAEKAWFGMEPAFSYTNLQMQLSTPDGKNELLQMPTFAPANQFALELDHMADCIANEKKPYTPGEEGLQDQKIMEAIYQSAKSGQPVTLPTVSALDTTRGAEPS